MSLKNQILQTIKERHQVSLDELYKLSDKIGMKHSTADRGLRDLRSPMTEGHINPDYDPNLGVVQNKRGAIVAYTYLGGYQTIEKGSNSGCCPSYGIYGIHAKECPVMQDLEHKAKILEQDHQMNLKLI